MSRILALTLLSPALVAQAPTAAPTFAQKFATESKAIEILKGEHPLAALAKAKALLPAEKLPFDKANLATAFQGIREWNALIDLHRLIYNCGVAGGHFEEAKAFAEKGRDLAKELQGLGLAAFENHRTVWAKAAEDATRLLDEMKALAPKVEADRATKIDPKLSMDDANNELMRRAADARRLEFLKANEATYNDTIEKAKKAGAPLERPTQSLEARTKEFDGPIAMWEKYLKEEAEDIATKYKADKPKYAAGLLRGVAAKPEDLTQALVSLHRAAFLDPANPAIQKRIDQLLGKAPATPEKPVKAKKKGK